MEVGNIVKRTPVWKIPVTRQRNLVQIIAIHMPVFSHIAITEKLVKVLIAPSTSVLKAIVNYLKKKVQIIAPLTNALMSIATRLKAEAVYTVLSTSVPKVAAICQNHPHQNIVFFTVKIIN